jgi:hypothetical protein
MAKTFVLHDESVNTYGFRMLTSGADLSEFRKNPVMLLGHNDWSLPIGKWENIRIEGGKILAEPVFDMEDETGRTVAGKVNNDFIRMASIGAWSPEELSDDPALKYPGQTGPTVIRWKVREASIVTIGANHNAIAFYDRKGNVIEIKNSEQLISLFDLSSDKGKNNKNDKKEESMKNLLVMLGLADTANEGDAVNALRVVIQNSDRLKAENATLTARIDAISKAEKEKRKTDAVALVDQAVKDARIDARAKESYLKLFDADFDSAKAALESIAKRQSVVGMIEAAKGNAATEPGDLQKMNWEELDRAEKLTLLKDRYPDVYAEKFEARFGCKPAV